MSFYGGPVGKSFVISKVFSHYGEMYDEAYNSANMFETALAPTLPENYITPVFPGCFVLICYGIKESDEYYANIQAEQAWFEAHAEGNVEGNPVVTRDIGLKEYTATTWHLTSDETSYDYDSSLWIKVLNENDKKHPFTYKYIGNIGAIYPEISAVGEWTIGGQGTGVIANGRQIELKVEYETNSDTGETVLGDDGIYWKYIDEDEWRLLVELKGLTNLEQYAILAAQYAAVAKSYTDGTGGSSVDRGLDDNGDPVDEKVANAKYYMEQTKSISDAATADITSIGENLSDSEALLGSVQNEVQNFTDLINNSPWGVTGDDEVIQARSGAITLNSRLNAFPYQFDLVSDMKVCNFLKPGDTAIAFGVDDIGDSNSTLYRVYENAEDPEIANDLKTETDSETGETYYVMTIPGGTTKKAEMVSLMNGYIVYSIAIFSGVGTGGGGGGSGTVGSLNCDFDQTTINSGETVEIPFYWTSPNAGRGKFYVIDNNATLIDGKDVAQGANSFTYSPRDGRHSLQLYVIDRGGLYTNDIILNLVVGGITLYTNFVDGTSKNTNIPISMTISMTTIYESDPIVLNYTLTGPSYPSGREFSTENTYPGASRSTSLTFNSSSNRLAAGAYTVSIQAVSNGYYSNTIKTTFILAAQNTIYISSSYDENSIPTQGTVITVPYSITLLNGSTFQVRYWMRGGDIIIDNDSETKEFDGIKYKLLSIATANVGNNSFKTNSLKQTTEGNPYSLIIEAYDYSTGEINTLTQHGVIDKPIKITVGEPAKSEVTMSSDGLIFYYDARQGQQNTDSNKDIWDNIFKIDAPLDNNGAAYDLQLKDFNYSTNGWLNNSLRFDGNAYCILNYTGLFANADRDGLTIDAYFTPYELGADYRVLEFAFSDNANEGVWISGNSADIVGTNNVSAHVDFNYGSPVRITLVIDPPSDNIIDDTGLGFIKIYVNGICCAATKYTRGLSVPVTRGGCLYLNRSRNINDLKIGYYDMYSLRIHNKAISSDSILRNYIYDISDTQLREEKWIKNGYSSSSVTTVPTMSFYTTRSDFVQMTKDDKITMRIEYNETPQISENRVSWDACEVTWQGTSSIAYPIKNFKIRLKNYELNSETGVVKKKKVKYHLDGMGKPESTFCLKADYMDSSHAHNTGNANFLNDTGFLNNYTLTPGQCEDLGVSYVNPANNNPWKVTDTEIYNILNNPDNPKNLEVRNSIYGRPIQLLIYYGTPTGEQDIYGNPVYEYGNPTFAGLYNFNLDKGNSDSFGFERGTTFPNCTSFEIKANSEQTAGAFRSLQFITDGTRYGYGNLDSTLIRLENENGEITYPIDTSRVNNFYYGIYLSDKNGDNKSNAVSYIFVTKKGDWIEVPEDQYDKAIVDSYKYSYYENDFELRFPDEEEYHVNPDNEDSNWAANYYKEFDKIRALIEWVNNAELTFTDEAQTQVNTSCEFYKNFSRHFDFDTILNYYHFVMATGLIDNLGKNLMINTWAMNKEGKSPVLKNGNYTRLSWFSRNASEYDETAETIENCYHYGLADLNLRYLEDGTESADGAYVKIYACDKDGNYDTLKLQTENTSNGLYLYEDIDGDGDWEDLSVEYPWKTMIDNNDILWYTHPYDLDSCLGCDNMGRLRYAPDIEMTPTNLNGNGYVDMVSKVWQEGGSPFNTSTSNLWVKFAKAFQKEIKARYAELRNTVLTDKNIEIFYYDNQISQYGEKMYNDDCYAKYLSATGVLVYDKNEFPDGAEDPDNPGQMLDPGWGYRSPQEFAFMLHGHDWERLSAWFIDRLYYLDSLYEYGPSYNNNPVILRSTAQGTFTFGIEAYRSQYMRVSWTNSGTSSGSNVITDSNPLTDQLSTLLSRTENDEIIYGWSDLTTFYDVSNGVYTPSDAGAYILVYQSNSLNEWIYTDESKTELKVYGYYPNTGLWEVAGSQKSRLRVGRRALNGSVYISPVSFTSPTLSSGDQEINVYCADNIKYLTGISSIVPRSLTLNNAKKLLDLECHSTALTSLNVTVNTMLRNIDLRGCSSLREPLNVAALNNLRTLDLRYTAIPSIETNPSGGNLTKIQFGRNTTEIDLRYQRQLKTIIIQGDTGENNSESSLLNQFGNVTKVTLIKCPLAHFEFIPIYKDSQGNDNEYASNDSALDSFIKKYGPISMFRTLTDLIIQDSLCYSNDNQDGLQELKLALPSLITLRVLESTITGLYFIGVSGQLISFPGNRNDPGGEAFSVDPNIETISFSGSGGVYLPAITDWSSCGGLKTVIFDATIMKKAGEEETFGNRFELFLPPYTLESFTTTSSSIGFTAIRQGSYSPTLPEFTGVDLRNYDNGIKINFTGFNNITEIIGFDRVLVGENGVSDFKEYFKNCRKLTAIKDNDNKPFNFNSDPIKLLENKSAKWTEYATTSMEGMFQNCSLLPWSVIEGFRYVKNPALENAINMFAGCTSFENPVIEWTEMNNLTTVERMFSGCSEVTSLTFKPSGCAKLQSMKNFAQGCTKLKNIDFDIRQIGARADLINSGMGTVTDMSSMFSGDTSLEVLDLSTWNCTSVSLMTEMCYGCTALKTFKIPEIFETLNLSSAEGLLSGCINLTSLFDNGEQWTFGPIKASLGRMFYGCTALITLGNFFNWNFINIKDLGSLLHSCRNFSDAIELAGREDFINVTSIASIFNGCSKIPSITLPNSLEGLSGTGLDSAFRGCSSITTLDVSSITAASAKLTSLSGLFQDCSQLVELIGYQGWNVINVTSMNYTFSGLNRIKELDLSGWSTSTSLKSVTGMFSGCTQLTFINGLTSLFTNGFYITSLAELFRNCRLLDFYNDNYTWSNYTTTFSSVSTTSSMFEGCSTITTITAIDENNYYICYGWKMPKLTNVNSMFMNCSNLTNLTLSGETGKISGATGFVSGCSRLVTLSVPEWDFSGCTGRDALANFVNGCSSLLSLRLKKESIVTNISVAGLGLWNNDEMRKIFLNAEDDTIFKSSDALAFILGVPAQSDQNTLTIGENNTNAMLGAPESLAIIWGKKWIIPTMPVTS